MRIRHLVFETTVLAAIIPLASLALVSEAAAESEYDDADGEWFEECLGTYDAEASWFQDCSDQLEGDYDCQSWVECFRDNNQFVQTRTCDPRPNQPNPCSSGEVPLPVQWHHDEVDYHINSGGTSDIHPGEAEITDELKHSIIESFDVWNQVECSSFNMEYDGPPTPEQPPPFYDDSLSQQDNLNIVTFKDDSWPHANYDAVALTTVTFRPTSGEILSADIEMNTDDYTFTDTDEDGEIQVDMRNTLTHEVGHFLGLDHSPNDDATMWASADTGETKKRDLHIADQQGICHIYPEGEPPRESSQLDPSDSDQSSGCATAAGPAGPLMPLLIAVLGLLGTAGRHRE